MVNLFRFPKTSPDGSFCVEVTLRVDDGPQDLAERISAWLQEWPKRNQSWQWFGHKLDFFDEFLREPYAVKCSGGVVSFKMAGRSADSKWWKDWLAFRLLEDLRHEFRQVGQLVSIRDCD